MATAEKRTRLRALSATRRSRGELEPIGESVLVYKARLAVLSIGSRGDFQPYLALALELQKHGYDVRMYGFVNHRMQAKQYGLQFFPIDYDCEDLLAHDPLIRAAMTDGDVGTFIKAVEQGLGTEIYHEIFRPVVDDMVEYAPKLLLTGATGKMFALGLAEAHGIPSFLVDLQPMYSSSQYPSIVLDQLGLGRACGCLNKLSHKLLHAQFSGEEMYGNPKHHERAFRASGFQLATDETISERALTSAMWSAPPFPTAVCVSPSLFPKPTDWPADVAVTGPLVVPLERTMRSNAPSPELEAFIETGPPPVYIGWGSMVVKSAEHMTELACRALYLARERGVVLSGWAHLSPSLLDQTAADYEAVRRYAEANVYFGNDLPHEWLFPRCKLTIHHGGSGTTHAAMRSGRPTVITPCFLDQFSYQRMAAQSGAGIASARLHKLAPAELAAAIGKAQQAEVQCAAKTLGERMRAEDGAAEVARLVERHIEEEIDTNKWKKAFEANWLLLKAESATKPWPRGHKSRLAAGA